MFFGGLFFEFVVGFGVYGDLFQFGFLLDGNVEIDSGCSMCTSSPI